MLLAAALPAAACTTFCVRGTDGRVFGRNYDYAFGDAGVDFACRSGGRMLDIDSGRGDVTAALMPYSPQANERQMLTAFGKTTRFHVTPQAARAEAAQIEQRRCASREASVS